jgi:predicted dehydrogenase
MGYHMVDLLLWNLAVPDTLHASISAAAAPNVDYDAEDTAFVTFTHPRGLHGSLTVSRFMPDEERVRLTGSGGILDATPKGVRFLRSDGELVESRALCGERSPTAQQLDYFSGVIRGEKPNFSSPTEHLVHARFVEACYASHAQRGTRQ